MNIVGIGGGEGKDGQDNGNGAEKKSEGKAVAKDDGVVGVAVVAALLVI